MKKGTLIAVGVFAVLLVLFFATREQKVSVGVKRLELGALDKSKITALEVSGAKAATLRKENGSWWVSDPAQPDKKHPADETQAKAAIDALAEVKSSDLVTEKAEKHGELEVDDAKGLKVKVTGERGPVAELIIGKSAKIGGFYIRKAGSNEVFTSTARFGWIVRKDASDWRKRAITGAKVEDVAQVTVRPAGAEPYTLKAGEGGAWALDEGTKPPEGFRFDAQAAQRLAQQVASLQAQDFAEGVNDEAAGFAGPHDVVEAKLKDGKALALHLGREGGVQETQDATLLKQLFDGVDAAGTKDSKVTVEDLQKVVADTAKGEDVKKLAARLTADPAAFARMDAGGYAGTPKDGAITVADLEEAARTIGLTPVRLDGDPQVYLIPAYVSQGIRKKLTDLRDTRLLAFEPEKVTKLVIQAGGKKTVAAREAGVWKVLEPKQLPAGFEFDPPLVLSQLGMIRGLRASRMVEPAVADAQAGLTKPTASVELTLDGGGSQVLRFGKELPGASAAKELFVKGSVDQALYAIPATERSRFEPGIELFRKRPPPPPNAQAMRGLDQLPPEIRKQIEAQLRQQQQQ